MAHLSPAVRRAFPYADYVPDGVLQRLSQAELADRLVYSSERTQVVKRASTPGQKRAITREIIAMMAAQPRAATEQEVKQRISKAAAAPDAFQGSALRRSAQELLTAQPPAPRNPDAGRIVKAAAGEDGLMLCCDENGTVIGVCQQSALIPVALPGQAKAGAVTKVAKAGVNAAAAAREAALLDYARRLAAAQARGGR